MTYDDIPWLPLCLTLSVLGGVGAALGFRRRGVVAGARLLAWALLPMAVYLIGAVSLLWRIGTAVTRFVTGFAFSPSVWLGVVLLLTSGLLFAVTGVLRRRGIGGRRPAVDRGGSRAVAPARTTDRDDRLSGFEDVEEILRRRGIR